MDQLFLGRMVANANSPYLSQYTLDALYRQVVEPLESFKRLNSKTLWQTPSESCHRIEQNPHHLYSLIVEAKREQSGYIPGTNIRYYHQLLTRIYILLYYAHRDNIIFRNVLSPALLRDMGLYGQEGFVKAHINQNIDKVIEQEKLINEAMGKKQDACPVNDVPSASPVVETKSDSSSHDAQQDAPRQIDIDAASTQNIKQTLTANEAALLMMTVCHEIGGLPNDKKMLHPLLTQCWGFTEQTASRALGMKPQQKTADRLSQVFESVSPKLARLIKDFPDKFEKLKLEKLKANNERKVKKK